MYYYIILVWNNLNFKLIVIISGIFSDIQFKTLIFYFIWYVCDLIKAGESSAKIRPPHTYNFMLCI